MEIKIHCGKERKESQILIADYFENSTPNIENRFFENEAYQEIVKPAFNTGDFSGKWKQTLLLYSYGKIPEHRVMLVGLGKEEEVNPFKIKISFGNALKMLRKLNISDISTFIDYRCCPDKLREIGAFLAEAAYLSQYKHPTFKKNKSDADRYIKNIYLILPENTDKEEEISIQKGIEEGAALGAIVNEVRDLVNKPSNYVTPEHLANYARMIARNDENIKCEILDKKEIASLGMGGLINVSKGSQEPPYLINCTYTPKDCTEYKTIAIVGKGITFDAGGISLKSSNGMYRQKDDMAGGALALGILKAAASLNLPIKIECIVPTCENLPSGSALKPGDIITAFDGTSVEVFDTDAEGRLILMDALGYAVSKKVDAIVDMATLTGSCTIALGRYTIGGMTNFQPIMDVMRDSGDYIFERVWQLPLMSEYKLPLKSMFADIKNYGGREAGAVTAGAFLSYFVQQTPWIHLDIAGVTWFDKETSLIPEGASGIGLRLLIDFLKRLTGEEHKEIWNKKIDSEEDPAYKEDEVPTDRHTSRNHHQKFIIS